MNTVSSRENTVSAPSAPLLGLALLGVVLITACTGDAKVASEHRPSIEGTSQAALAPLVPRVVEDAYTSIKGPPPGFTSERIVGFVPDGLECPEGNADWESIAGISRPGLARPGTNVPVVRFCGFRWRHPGTPVNSFTAPAYCPKNHPCCNGTATSCAPSAPGESWLEPDDGGIYVSALPSAANEAVAKAIRQQHRAAMGTPVAFPKGKKHFTELPRNIKVYVLDNSDAEHPGVHGDAVAGWIKQTACPDAGDCGLWIEKRRVIGESGKGNVVELALAIMDAVDDAAGFPALINLSLQIHPKRVFEPNREPRTSDDVSNHLRKFPHKLLEAALNYARCHGVVVVSAAGNRDGGATPFYGYGLWGANLTYPAAFNEETDRWACNGETAGASLPGQLSIAVGAILANGADAPSRRENGQPCLVAPSTGLATDGAPMEGTSFSAAAMTGAIASIWRYAPFAKGHEVVGMLSQHAQAIPRGATSRGCSFAGNSASGVVDGYNDAGRIHLCKGLKEALQRTCTAASKDTATSNQKLYKFTCAMADQLSCSDIQVSSVAQTSAGQSAMLASTAEELSLQRTFVSGVSSVPEAGLCSSSLAADPTHRNALSCPDQVMDNGTILANGPGTSPGGIGCPGCSLLWLSDGSLWLYGALASASIGSPTLNFTQIGVNPLQGGMIFFSGAMERTYELGDILREREPGQNFAIQIESNVPAGSVVEASFAYTEADPSTAGTAHVNGVPVIQAN